MLCPLAPSNHQGPMKPTRKTKKRLYSTVKRRAPRRGKQGDPASEGRALQVLPPTHLARFRVSPDSLAWKCEPASFAFRSTREVSPLRGMIGQGQVVAALFGALVLGLVTHRSSQFSSKIIHSPSSVRNSSIVSTLRQCGTMVEAKPPVATRATSPSISPTIRSMIPSTRPA